MATHNLTSDYRNEVYFEDWSASATLTRNGTDGRVYGGDCNLIHIPDGRRADVGRTMARVLDRVMRDNCENRTEQQAQEQLLCPGCFMVAVFNMAVELANANGQPLSELGNSLASAFAQLASGGAQEIEHIIVQLD